MVFHSLISARLVPHLDNTRALHWLQSHPANRCVLPPFLGLLIDLPREKTFSHRGVGYGGCPTIFIVSSQKPDPPFASLFVPLRKDAYPLFVHLFPPIPISTDALSQPIYPVHAIESSSVEAIIHLFFSSLKDSILSLARTAFPLSVQTTWPSFPRYDAPAHYLVAITGCLPLYNPHHRVVWDSLCFINSIRAEFSYTDWKTVPLDVWLNWLRRIRSQPRAMWVSPPNPTPPTPSNPIMVDLLRVQSLTLSDDTDPGPQESEDFEVWKSIPPPIPSSSFDLIVLDIIGLMQDRMGALQSYLGVSHVQRLLELENMEFSAAGATYAEILARSLNRLAMEMPTVRFDGHELFRRLVKRRADLDSQFHVLLQSGIPIIGYSTIDGASLSSCGFMPPSWVRWMYVPDDAEGLYRPCTQHLAAVLEHARGHFQNSDPSRILVISTSVLRRLAPATEMGMATVIPDFLHDLEIQALHHRRLVIAPGTLPWTQRIQPLTHLLTRFNATKEELCVFPLIHHVYAVLDDYHGIFNDSGKAVVLALNLLNNQEVVIKYSVNAQQNIIIEREALVYRQLAGCPFLPRVLWSGPIGHLQGICLEFLGPTLDQLRRLCRGHFSHRTVIMIAIRLLSFLKFAHSAGVVIQDLKPQNLAVGFSDPTRIYAFDFDISRTFLDPKTGTHLPYNHVKSPKATRRDDIAMLAHTLLHLHHGALPWESLSAPDTDAYFQQMAHMKTPGHVELEKWLQQSPPIIAVILSHARGLDYQQEPDYDSLLQSCHLELGEHGWLDDGQFDWTAPELAPMGTLLDDEFRFIPKNSVLPLLGYS
ncbi:kinase-like protein [Hymenopellis radicata]|nr:kinase-like protein [Hymenopellis radicata]